FRKRPDAKAGDVALSVHLKATFAASGRTYGSRRLRSALNQTGMAVGRYRVRRLMREHHLRPVWRRKFVITTDSKHSQPVADNLLNRQFDVSRPNKVWAADLTHLRTRQGWLYLAVVMDLFSRKVIGWSMSASPHTGLATAALRMALQQRRPGPGLIVHSDRGVQYVAQTYQSLLREHGIQCSMSRKGDCWDNAVVERF